MHPAYLRDGRVARIRRVGLEDASRVASFVQALSPQARRARFFGAVSTLSPRRLREMLASPGLSVAAFGDDGRIVAHAQYALVGGQAEFALVVDDAWQGKSLGEQLLGLLRRHARDAGARVLGGFMLADNHAMRRLARKLGFAQKYCADATLLRFEAS
jgi:RimJ/RimL family protein N-acetyltransferase